MAEIGLLDLPGKTRISGLGFENDMPAGERVDAIGARERLLDELLDQEHRRALAAQFADDGEHAIDQNGREPAEGSSSIRRRGRRTSPCATTSICCWPPDSEPPRFRRLLAISGK